MQPGSSVSGWCMPRRLHRTRARIGQKVAAGPKPGVGSGPSYIRAARCHPPGPKRSRPGLEEAGPQTALCSFRHTRSGRAVPLCVVPAVRGGHPTGSPGARRVVLRQQRRACQSTCKCAQDAQRGSSAGAERSDTGPKVIEVRGKFSSYQLTRHINIADTPQVPLGQPPRSVGAILRCKQDAARSGGENSTGQGEKRSTRADLATTARARASKVSSPKQGGQPS